jgi:hypothetical protein
MALDIAPALPAEVDTKEVMGDAIDAMAKILEEANAYPEAVPKRRLPNPCAGWMR